MPWVSADSLLEPVEEELKIWNRADIDLRANRVRDYVPPRLRTRKTGNVNSAKTHCPQGHPYNEANTYKRKSGRGRECRVCRRERRDG